MLVLARSFFIPKSLLEMVVVQNKATIYFIIIIQLQLSIQKHKRQQGVRDGFEEPWQ